MMHSRAISIRIKMQARWACLAACVAWACGCPAQGMREVFVAMPDSLCGVMTKMNREDCVDFLESNMKAEVTNRYGRRSELLALTKDYLLLQATPQSTWEMKLLPLSDSTNIVCVVRTVCAPVCDSKVEFFAADWRPLPADGCLQPPGTDLFFLPVDSLHADSLAALRREAEPAFLKASLSPDDASLSYIYTTVDFMTKESADKLAPYLRPSPVRYEWEKGKFVRKENP